MLIQCGHLTLHQLQGQAQLQMGRIRLAVDNYPMRVKVEANGSSEEEQRTAKTCTWWEVFDERV